MTAQRAAQTFDFQMSFDKQPRDGGGVRQNSLEVFLPNFLNLPACPLCQAEGRALGVLPTYVHGWDMVVESAFRHCDHCDFAWMATPPDNESLASYYAANDQFRRPALTAEEAHHIGAQIDFLDPSPGRHLEIGPDNGTFLELMRCRIGGEFSFNEMNVEAARRLSERGFSSDQGRYATATLRHVFEHIVDPVSFLTALARRADRIFVEVPDYSALGLRKSDRFQFEHVNYFSLTSMHMVAKRAGLSIERVEFAATPGYSTTPNRVMRVIFAAGSSDDDREWDALLHDDLQRLDRFARALDGRVAIYGAGVLTSMLLAANPRASVAAIYDLDEKKQGRPMLGVTVQSPEEIDETRFDTLLLTVVGYEQEVRDFLRGRVSPEKIRTLEDFLP
jgi:hypothetical protein